MGTYDATTKYLIEAHAADWLALAGLPVRGGVRVVDAELSTVTSAPDKLVRVGGRRGGYAAHVEFQSARDADLDERVLAYNVLARRRHRVPVHSVAFLLRPEAGPPAVRGSVRWPAGVGSPLSFDYRLVRVWQVPTADLLAGPLGTLPLAPIGAIGRGDVPRVIRRMRHRLDHEVSSPVAGELWTATRILMGLRYTPADARALLQGVRHMRESTTYQEIVDEGRAEGRVEGRAEGGQELLLRMATKRFGVRPSKASAARLKAVTNPAELDRLGEALLAAAGWKEWLASTSRVRRHM